MYKYLTLILLLHVAFPACAQNSTLYTYQDLSHAYYAKQRDSLRKAWICPTISKDKNVQKQYVEIWQSRTDFITRAIDQDNFVHDGEVYDYVSGIVDQLISGNKKIIASRPLLLIDRSPSVNAYAVGGNIIVVNLGLISFAQSREELALAVAHELSHNLLQHPENAMRQRAEWLGSDEYKKSLEQVLDSKYERLTRLRKILEGYGFNRSRHQRYREGEADSMAIALLRNSNIPFEPRSFLRLDSADMVYRQPLKQALGDYFRPYGVSFDNNWAERKSKGLSTRKYNFQDTTSLRDSLKTHPDCQERYNKTIAFSTAGKSLTAIPVSVKRKADRMLIWNLYNNMSLTTCMYRILLEKDKGNNDEWYDFMVHNIFTGLLYADKELKRFNSIGIVQKELTARDYYQLQNMLEQIPRDQLEAYCKTLQNGRFWKGVTAQEQALKNLMYLLALDPNSNDKEVARVAREFKTNHGMSMYCEFTGNFEKK